MELWSRGKCGEVKSYPIVTVSLYIKPFLYKSCALLIILFIFCADTIFETCDIVVLAVKPNLFPVIVRELQVCNGPANQLVLSVMSGITICEIEKV